MEFETYAARRARIQRRVRTVQMVIAVLAPMSLFGLLVMRWLYGPF